MTEEEIGKQIVDLAVPTHQGVGLIPWRSWRLGENKKHVPKKPPRDVLLPLSIVFEYRTLGDPASNYSPTEFCGGAGIFEPVVRQNYRAEGRSAVAQFVAAQAHADSLRVSDM